MKKIEIKGTMAPLTKGEMGTVTGGFGVLETDPGIGITPYASNINCTNPNSGNNCYNGNCVCQCGSGNASESSSEA